MVTGTPSFGKQRRPGTWQNDPITDLQAYRIRACREYLRIEDSTLPKNKGEASDEIQCLMNLVDLMHEYELDLIHNPEQYIYETIQY